MPEWVRGVVTQQGTDISDLINQEAEHEQCSARGLCSLLDAESNLNETARRPLAPADDERYWPDVSFGLGQQTAAYAVGYGIGDGTPSPENIALVEQTLNGNPALAIHVAAVQYGAYYRSTGGHWGAVAKYNGGPGATWSSIPANNQANYRAAWENCAKYLGGDPPGHPSTGWQPIDVRDRYPYAPGNGEYTSRPLASIDRVVYHHGDSRAPADSQEDELALIDAYYALHTAQDGVHGWPSLGYHMAVAPSGRVYLTNGLQLIAYHAGNWPVNTKSVGIVFLGDYTNAAPSQTMLDAAIQARYWAAQQAGRPDLPISGHKDWYGTTCPGNWWPEPGRTLLSQPSSQEEDPVVIAELEKELAAVRGMLAQRDSENGALRHDVIQRAEGMLTQALAQDPADPKLIEDARQLLHQSAS